MLFVLDLATASIPLWTDGNTTSSVTDFPGNDIFNTSTTTLLASPEGPVGPFNVTDMESCMNACFYVSGCVGITWQAASSSCAFKYGLPAPIPGHVTRPQVDSAILVGIWPRGPSAYVPPSVVDCPDNNTAVYQSPDGSFYNIICDVSFPSSVLSSAAPGQFSDLQLCIDSCFGVPDCVGVTWSPSDQSCTYYAESPNNPVISTDHSAILVGIYPPDRADTLNISLSTANIVLNSDFSTGALTPWTFVDDTFNNSIVRAGNPGGGPYVLEVILRQAQSTWAEVSQNVSTAPGVWYQLGFTYELVPLTSGVASGEIILNCTAQDASTLTLLTNLSVSLPLANSVRTQLDSLGNLVDGAYSVSVGSFQAESVQTEIGLGFYASVAMDPGNNGSPTQSFYISDVTLIETEAPDLLGTTLSTVNAILNSGFETSDLTGWTYTSSDTDVEVDVGGIEDDYPNPNPSSTEALRVILQGNSQSTLSWAQVIQNVSTIPGLWYNLGFTYVFSLLGPSYPNDGIVVLNCTAGDASDPTPLASLAISVLLPAGGQQPSSDSLGNSLSNPYDWHTTSVGSFQAQSTWTEVAFGFYTDTQPILIGDIIYVDNVTLIETSAPGTLQDNYDFCRMEAHSNIYTNSATCTRWDLHCTTGLDGFYSNYSSTGTGTIQPYAQYNTIISNGTNTVTVKGFKSCIDACALIGRCTAVTWSTNLGACYYKTLENYNTAFDELLTYDWQSAVAVRTC